jgi:membrane protease YdiL (CAAX protease family)
MIKKLRINISSEKATLVLLLFLLFLIFLYKLLLSVLFPSKPIWTSDVFYLGMYISFCILIWINRNSLIDNHIGKSSICLLILSGTLARLSALSLTNIFFWILGLFLIICFARGCFHFEIQCHRLGWIVFSSFLGIGIPLILYILLRLFVPAESFIVKPWPGLLVGGINVLVQILYVAVYEEFLFRGFLWGFLKKRNWDTKWVLLFQGVLFWAAHLFTSSNKPFTVWVAIPLLGLILGYIAYRSRSVTNSVILHALYNTVLLLFL